VKWDVKSYTVQLNTLLLITRYRKKNPPWEAVRPSSSIIVYFDVVRRNVNKEELDLHNAHKKYTDKVPDFDGE